jgi:transposase
MKYFAGMDVSLEETAICVVDEAGRMIKEARAASEPNALHAVLASFNLVFERVGLEACSLAAWLHGELTSAGWPAVCIETRHAKAAMGAKAPRGHSLRGRGKDQQGSRHVHWRQPFQISERHLQRS